MKKGIIGKKLGMTQIFDENGLVIPVTVIEAGPCYVTQKKTAETDGYEAVQLAFEDAKDKHTGKPAQGHFKKAGVSAKKHLKEFRLENAADLSSNKFRRGGGRRYLRRRRKGRHYRHHEGTRIHRRGQEMERPHS